MTITDEEGNRELDWKPIEMSVDEACDGLAGVEPGNLLESFKRNIYDGISTSDLHAALVRTANTLIEQDPNYRFVAAVFCWFESDRKSQQNCN